MASPFRYRSTAVYPHTVNEICVSSSAISAVAASNLTRCIVE